MGIDIGCQPWCYGVPIHFPIQGPRTTLFSHIPHRHKYEVRGVMTGKKRILAKFIVWLRFYHGDQGGLQPSPCLIQVHWNAMSVQLFFGVWEINCFGGLRVKFRRSEMKWNRQLHQRKISFDLEFHIHKCSGTEPTNSWNTWSGKDRNVLFISKNVIWKVYLLLVLAQLILGSFNLSFNTLQFVLQ